MAGKYRKYPSYAETEVKTLGCIPLHWVPKRLKQMARIKNGQDYKHVEISDAEEGFPVIGSGGRFSYASEFMYEGESVLLGRKGTIDKPLYVNFAFWTVDTMFYTQVFKSTCAKYLYYCAITIPFNYYSTNTALPSMTQEDLGSNYFAVPEFVEQQTIANFLDNETSKIDTLINKQQQLIKLLKEKRQAVISHAVTKGLNPDAPMKDSGVEWLGEVPAHWEKIKVKRLFKFAKRQGYEGLLVLSVYRDYGVIVKSSRDDNFNKTPEDLSSYQLVNEGDLVINKMKAWQGSMGISKFRGITSPDYAVYQPLHEYRDDYLHFWLRSSHMPDVYLNISTGIRPSQWRLDLEEFGNLNVFVPPQNERAEIVELIKAIEGKYSILIDLSEKQIDLLQERRTALISAAVTGKIDVRNWQPAG